MKRLLSTYSFQRQEVCMGKNVQAYRHVQAPSKPVHGTWQWFWYLDRKGLRKCWLCQEAILKLRHLSHWTMRYICWKHFTSISRPCVNVAIWSKESSCDGYHWRRHKWYSLLFGIKRGCENCSILLWRRVQHSTFLALLKMNSYIVRKLITKSSDYD